MKIAEPHLARAITSGLFVEDVEHHYRSLLGYDTNTYDPD